MDHLRCKARPINTIVDVVISPLVGLLNGLPQLLRKQIQLLVLLGQKIIELIIEHAQDLTALIAHNLILLFVVKCGNREPAFVFGIDVEV